LLSLILLAALTRLLLTAAALLSALAATALGSAGPRDPNDRGHRGVPTAIAARVLRSGTALTFPMQSHLAATE
jgi:hypothetical protein